MKLARLALVVAALLFSTGGAGVKACSMTSWQIAGFRCGIAALVLLVAVPGARAGFSWRAAGVGVAYAGTLVLYVLANRLTTAANATFLQGTAPLYVMAIAPRLLGERSRARDLLFMGALAAGLVLVVRGGDAPSSSAPDPATGNLLGVATGACWAATVLGLRALARREDTTADAALAPVVLGNLLAFLACLPWALPVETAPSGGDLGVLLYLGAFQIGLAYVLVTKGLRRVPALEASLLLMLEPTFGPVWAWLLHGEVPATTALLGGLLVLAATAGKSVADVRAP